MNEPRCLTSDEMLDHLLGRVGPDALDTFERHLAACPRCREFTARYEHARDSLLCDLASLRRPSHDPITKRWLGAASERGRSVFRDPDGSRAFHLWSGSFAGADADQGASSTSEPARPARAPDGYECGRLLGAGGFGRAHLAFHRDSGRMVAIKTPAARWLHDERVLARFEREARVLAHLDHPAIVRCFEAARFDDGSPYMVLELLEGEHLAAIVQRIGPLPVTAACRIVRDLLVALEHARERGVVHRDVAPKNVFWEVDGSIRLVDWGLARFEDDPRPAASRDLSTRTGEFWGTPTYAPPEQWRHFADCDCRADLYAAAWTLVYLFTGEAPGRPLGPDDSTIRCGAELRPLVARRPDLPTALANVLRSMLQADRDQRPSTPGRCADLLAPFLGAEHARPFPATRADVESEVGMESGVDELWRRSRELVEACSEPLLKQGQPEVAALCRLALDACADRPTAKPLRVAFVGAAGAGKTELIRALVPELPELDWQVSPGRFVGLRYSESREARVREDGKPDRSVSWSALESRGPGAGPVAVELGLPSEFLARGFVIEELRHGREAAPLGGGGGTGLQHADVVVWCVSPELELPRVNVVRELLASSCHEAVVWALTRMDTVRRRERDRLSDLCSWLASLTSLGADGVCRVAALAGDVGEVPGAVSGIEPFRERLLQFFGAWSVWPRARRPLLLLQRAVDLARAAVSGDPQLESMAEAVRTHLEAVAAAIVAPPPCCPPITAQHEKPCT